MLALVVGNGMLLTALGLGVGMLAAVFLTRPLAGLVARPQAE